MPFHLNRFLLSSFRRIKVIFDVSEQNIPTSSEKEELGVQNNL
jgi:hypothetical protein